MTTPETPCPPSPAEPILKAPRCNARSKRHGGPCGAPAMPNGKCYHHGGATPRGAASVHYKGRGYSADLSMERGKALDAIKADDELVNLREDIALITLRIKDLLKREVSGERGTLWDDLQWAVLEAQNEGKQLDPAQLAPIIEAGRTNEGLWQEVRELLQERAKLVGTEGKRQADMGETATKEQVKAAIVWLVNATKDAASAHIANGEERQAFLTALSREVTRGMAPKQAPSITHQGKELET